MKVLIIGNGIAGMSAAIEAAELDDEVILVSPVQSERTQSVMAAEGINAVVDTAEEDSVVWHANDTLESGCFLEKEEGKDWIKTVYEANGLKFQGRTVQDG